MKIIKVLVSVKTDILETLKCRLSLRLFHGSVNIPECKGKSTISETVLTDREDVGFKSNSDAFDTHNFNIQEVLKTWCM